MPKSTTKAPKTTAPRAPRASKKASSTPATATQATQEVQTAKTPEAIVANAQPEAKALVETLNCGVCHQDKVATTFVILPKSLGTHIPEEGVKCGDCHEDLVASHKASGTQAATYYKLLDSRKRDQVFDREQSLIKKFAGRRDTNLKCDGAPGEPCGIYHGLVRNGNYVVCLVSPITTVRDGDLSILPKPPVLCLHHKERYEKRLKDANPDKAIVIKWGSALSEPGRVEVINQWRQKEKARLDDLAEQDRLQAAAEADLYAQPAQNTRPSTRRQENRFAPSGKTHFGQLNRRR